MHVSQQTDEAASRLMAILEKTPVLVTEVGTVRVIATEVSIVRGCGTEEDSGR